MKKTFRILKNLLILKRQTNFFTTSIQWGAVGQNRTIGILYQSQYEI